MDTFDVETLTSPKNLSLLFKLSMWWRIFYGFLKVVVGIALLKMIGQSLSDFAYLLMAHELTGPKGDAVLEQLYNIFDTHDITVTYFIACYFLFWGIVDMILSGCLLRHIRQAFPITMSLIALFICYGVFRLTHTHSYTLAGIIVIDIAILYLVYTEYKKMIHTSPVNITINAT